MKAIPRLLLPGIWLVTAQVAPATNPSMGLVTHPVYLGAHSDPQAIPLSATAVWHNYGYGIHKVISRPRPFPAGGLITGQGIHYDMNLASVFDIQVVPEDGTMVPELPVTIKAGRSEIPPGSPYTREQALVATLWSLILTSPGSEEAPLTVTINSHDPEFGKYAGEYVLAQDQTSLLVGEIPGSKLVRDSRGVVFVRFEEKAAANPPEEEKHPPQLAFVPLSVGGGASDDDQIALVPHWTGNEPDAVPLGLLWTAIPRGMNVLSAKRGENANPLHVGRLDSQDLSAGSTDISFYGFTTETEPTGEERRLFATACLGILHTAGVTEEKPFTLSFRGDPADAWEILATDGWETEEKTSGGAIWRKSFTSTATSILGYHTTPRSDGGWWVEAIPNPEGGAALPSYSPPGKVPPREKGEEAEAP